ncbi:hypothetical protein PITC_019960 [Penicillium italicum]|uniref:Rhodopsin domain-containing protein n=1 Tax=Penicillium italicum TaxID=40296 RepID=A0A0A2KRV3_PENIT|nr:hypothetical protein PITC_019960 [Penicillium italicum]
MADLHEDYGPTLWVVITVFVALSTLAVAARFGARRLQKLSLGADDWIICVALFWNWLLYGLFVGCRINGLGKHRETLSLEQVVAFAKLLYFSQIFYVLGPPTVKLALLFLYRRIFQHSNLIRLIDGMIVLISVWVTVMAFLAIFNCKPISAFWTADGTCLDFKNLAIGYVSVNIATDFVVCLMPIPKVWNLQIPKPQKIALSLIFSLGLFDCTAAVGRLRLAMLVIGQYDITWLYSNGYMWSIIEISTGIICTCLPTMRVLLKIAFGGAFARIFGTSSVKASHQPSSNTPWSRTKEYYNSIGESRLAEVSSNTHHSKNGSESHGADWDIGSQRILVIDEVNVELHSLKQMPPAKAR